MRMQAISDRNVYLLGAGASATAGAPVIRNFLDRSRELYDQPFSGLAPGEREHFRRVFDFRREVAQAREKIHIDLDDIEQLFGLVEISHRLGDIESATRKSMVYLIAKTLQMSIDSHREKRPRFAATVVPDCASQFLKHEQGPYKMQDNLLRIDMYDYFAALVAGVFDDTQKRQSRRDTIITFNYDLVCEHALRRFGIFTDYHLDLSLVEDQRQGQSGGRVSVLKLHGSTNWGICEGCNKRIVILSEKLTDSPAEFESLRCSGCNDGFVPLLIPPSWDKSGYAQIIAPVWKHAVEELKSATRICIIGYSIPETDAFFKYLITLALAGNHQLYKLIVVDYRAPIFNHPRSLEVQGHMEDRVRPRYISLLDPLFQERRFRYFDNGFMEFLRGCTSRVELDRCEMLMQSDFGF